MQSPPLPQRAREGEIADGTPPRAASAAPGGTSFESAGWAASGAGGEAGRLAGERAALLATGAYREEDAVIQRIDQQLRTALAAPTATPPHLHAPPRPATLPSPPVCSAPQGPPSAASSPSSVAAGVGVASISPPRS
eukprot:tig00021122_g18439.t1